MDDSNAVSILKALGDERRMRMVSALFGDRELTASHLALEAGISPSTASAHLKILVDAGVLKQVPAPPKRGNHRFYALTGPAIAETLEHLVGRYGIPAPESDIPGTQAHQFRNARFCYDHLAGRLGTAITRSIIDRKWLVIEDNTPRKGERYSEFARLGLDLDAIHNAKRPVLRLCKDWSETDMHVSGALGSALANRFFTLGWIERQPKSRIVTVTPEGKSGLFTWFHIDLT